MKAKLLWLTAVALVLSACNSNTKKKENADSVTVTATTPADTTPVDMHNAENSLDFEGTYDGTVPSGSVTMKTTLHVNKDKTFELIERMVNSKDAGTFTSKGKWMIHNGNTLTLNFDNVADRILQYHIEEGQLTQLDMKGKAPVGTESSKYQLKKIK